MTHQIPLLSDEKRFEKLVRDILRLDYDDPGIECFGRKGQRQDGIDGFSPVHSGVIFQCKLKDVRYSSDNQIRMKLMTEMESDLKKTHALLTSISRFIFASTFKNDTRLQQQAQSLSTDCLVIEYWGWDTISEKIWKYNKALLPIYYPEIPIPMTPGFRVINEQNIKKAIISDPSQRRQLSLDYYCINDRDDVVFKIVCNNMDVRNDIVIDDVLNQIEASLGYGTTWIIGNGGSGKTTILHRLSIELAEKGHLIYFLNLEAQLELGDIDHILNFIKYSIGSSEYPRIGSSVLCIDNPAVDETSFHQLLKRIFGVGKNIHVLVAERAHRYLAMKRSGCMTFIHGEKIQSPIKIRNSRHQRRKVYDQLFELLNLPENVANEVREMGLNEDIVYVNATYNILLELKKRRQIDFDFDWDDYRKLTIDLPAFQGTYRYIALFYLMGVKVPFEVIARIGGADITQKRNFLLKFRGLDYEPIVKTEWRDATHQKHVLLRTKHEIVSDIYFNEYPDRDKNELMKEWCENTNFENEIEIQTLINVIGAKKNYIASEANICFESLIDFLLTGYLSEKVSKIKKLYETLILAQAWTLLSQGKKVEATKQLKQALELFPNNLHFRTELSKIYQRQNKLDEAIAILNEILRVAPQDINSRTELARIYHRQNRLKDAKAVLEESLAIDPEQLHPRTELARIYYRQKKYKKAETILRDLMNIDPNNLVARTELAKIYRKRKKDNKAEAILKEVLAIAPKDLNSRTELANTYLKQKKFKEAERVLHGLLNIDNKNLIALTKLSQIYREQGMLTKAKSFADKALSINPTDSFVMSELLGVLRQQKKIDESVCRFMSFIHQPEYKFGKHSQAAVFRFLLCCRDFGLKNEANIIFKKFGSKFDKKNKLFFKRYFKRG